MSCRNPYVEDPLGLPERTNESAGTYAKACVEVAKELSIPVINIWSKMQQFPGWEKSFLRYCKSPEINKFHIQESFINFSKNFAVVASCFSSQ